MLEMEFLRYAQNTIKAYREFPLPAFVCDKSFHVHWSNAPAKLSYDFLESPGALSTALAEFNQKQLWDTMEQQGCCNLEGVFPLSENMLTLSPIYGDEGIVGAVVLIVGAHSIAWTEKPRLVSRTASAFSDDVRQGVEHIFSAMDAAYVKAMMIDSNLWFAPHLNQISLSAYRLLRTTANLSEYARLQGGILELQPEGVDVFEWLRDISSTIEELGREADVPVSFDIPPGDALIVADLKRLELAFYNVLHNSMTYTQPGNKVLISARRLPDETVILVEDQGSGIPEDLLEQVFVPYFSLPGPRGTRGTGLGLTLARRLISVLGGYLTLSSRTDRGTSVAIRLPNRSFSSSIPLRQDALDQGPYPIKDRFSNLYVGLVGVISPPFDPDATPQ